MDSDSENVMPAKSTRRQYPIWQKVAYANEAIMCKNQAAVARKYNLPLNCVKNWVKKLPLLEVANQSAKGFHRGPAVTGQHLEQFIEAEIIRNLGPPARPTSVHS